eukprot:s194_g24.t1
MTFNLRGALVDDDDPPPAPETLEEVSPWAMTLMMEFSNFEKFADFMNAYPQVTGMRLSYDEFYELRLAKSEFQLSQKFSLKTTKTFMFTISKMTFGQHYQSQSLNIDLLVIQREMEDLENKKNKFAIEGDDDTLVDLAVQWLNMFNDTTKKLIAKKIIKEEDESITLPKKEVCDPKAPVQQQEKKEEWKEPTVPAPEHVSMNLDKKEKEAEEKYGSSVVKEEPSASASSSKKEEARADKKSSFNKKLEEPKPRMYYDQDFTGCEDDSF